MTNYTKVKQLVKLSAKALNFIDEQTEELQLLAIEQISSWIKQDEIINIYNSLNNPSNYVIEKLLLKDSDCHLLKYLGNGLQLSKEFKEKLMKLFYNAHKYLEYDGNKIEFMINNKPKLWIDGIQTYSHFDILLDKSTNKECVNDYLSKKYILELVDFKMLMKIVKFKPDYVKHFKTLTESELMILLSINSNIFEFIENKTEIITIVAITNDWKNIKFVTEQSENIQMLAYSNFKGSFGSELIKIIPNPCKQLRELLINTNDLWKNVNNFDDSDIKKLIHRLVIKRIEFDRLPKQNLSESQMEEYAKYYLSLGGDLEDVDEYLQPEYVIDLIIKKIETVDKYLIKKYMNFDIVNAYLKSSRC